MARQSVATQAILRGATQAASGAKGSRSVVTQAVLSEAVRVAGGAACQSGERQASLNVATAATGDGEAEASRDETQATCAPWRKDECSLFGNRDTKPIRAARSRMQSWESFASSWAEIFTIQIAERNFQHTLSLLENVSLCGQEPVAL